MRCYVYLLTVTGTNSKLTNAVCNGLAMGCFMVRVFCIPQYLTRIFRILKHYLQLSQKLKTFKTKIDKMNHLSNAMERYRYGYSFYRCIYMKNIYWQQTGLKAQLVGYKKIAYIIQIRPCLAQTPSQIRSALSVKLTFQLNNSSPLCSV